MLALLLVLAETIILSKESQFAPMFALTLGDQRSPVRSSAKVNSRFFYGVLEPLAIIQRVCKTVHIHVVGSDAGTTLSRAMKSGNWFACRRRGFHSASGKTKGTEGQEDTRSIN